ncbi:NYN domain-containing protein [Dokdonia ponticola]|uniref:NYN domain-containing protein n=1 Tax=Dokdonia ponticola TaxID=2041041 RepID=UPI0036D346B4
MTTLPIKMTVDILSHLYNDNFDTLYLVAGDGDYLPLIKEVIRRGKLVYLAFFSRGLNKELLNHVDKYICLDEVYFD